MTHPMVSGSLLIGTAIPYCRGARGLCYDGGTSFKRGAAHALDTARWANAAGLAAVAMAVGGLRKAD